MAIFFEKMFMKVLLWILNFLDTIFDLCSILAGTKAVNADGTTLIDVFLGSDVVTQIFLSLITLGIIVAAVSMVAAIIKHIINLNGGERKPQSRIVGQGIASVFATLVLATVMTTGIALANTALVTVNNIFQEATGGYSIGDQIFIMSVEESYVIEAVERDEKGEIIGYINKMENGELVKETGWINGVPENFTIEGKNADEIYGTFKTNMIGFEIEGKPNGGYINIGSFNFFLAYFSAIVLLVSLALAMLGLVKRLYDLVLLFLALPLIAGTIPLDDGAKLKLWRETVISKVILAYGVVFAVNVFMIAISIINKSIDFSNTAIFKSAFMGAVFKIFLVCGGGLSINGGQILFARLFGTSAEESREMTQALRGAVVSAKAVGGFAKSTSGLAKRLAIGGEDRDGNQRQGLIPGVVNLAGNALGGNAYRGYISNMSEQSKNLGNVLRGSRGNSFGAVSGSSFGGSMSGSGTEVVGGNSFSGGYSGAGNNISKALSAGSGGLGGSYSGSDDSSFSGDLATENNSDNVNDNEHPYIQSKPTFMEKGGVIGSIAHASEKRSANKQKKFSDFAHKKAEEGIIVAPSSFAPKHVGDSVSQSTAIPASETKEDFEKAARHFHESNPLPKLRKDELKKANPEIQKARKSSGFYNPPNKKYQAKLDTENKKNYQNDLKKIIDLSNKKDGDKK